MTKTFEEIASTLAKYGVKPSEIEWLYPAERKEAVEAELGKWEEVPAGSRGGEDEGSSYRRVFHFVDHDVYVAVTGYYTSYDGTEYDDDFTEVRPVVKEVTVFE